MAHLTAANIRTRPARIILVMAVTLTAFFAAVAQSNAGVASCYSSGFCIWSGTEYDGSIWQYNIDEYVQDTWFPAGAGEGHAQSFYNNRVHITWVSNEWADGTHGSTQACITPGAAVRNLAEYLYPNGAKANKEIYSLVLSSSNTTCPEGWEFYPIP